MKARDHVYDDLGEGTWNLVVIRIFQTFTLCIILASKASQKKNSNKIKNKLWTPSPTHQTYTQDPTSDKSQGGGVPDPRSPSGSAHADK